MKPKEITTPTRMQTPILSQQDTTEISKDKEVVMDVVKSPIVEPQTHVTTLAIEETTKKTVEEQQELRENVNVYTSRFDDENIWANISRSTERLDMEWAKMPPLPKFTPSTQRTKTKCHCQHYRAYGSKDSLNNDKCKCKNSLTIPYQFSDLNKYGNMLTKNLIHHRNTNKTTIPQPLKPKTTTSADCHLFHHESKHNLALDLKHPNIKSDNTDQEQLANTSKKVETTTNTHNNDTSTNSAISTGTYERSNSRSKYRKTPRLDCHTRTRCYSHDRLMDHHKTEPLTWLQQHLVLKQTIKACYKCPLTNCDNALKQSCCRIDTTSTACCQAPHVIRACCNNKECLRDIKKPNGKQEESPQKEPNPKQELTPQQKEEPKQEFVSKPEHDKGTNTEEFKEEKKLTKKKPVKVDINVRLVPKSSKREKVQAKTSAGNQELMDSEHAESTALVAVRKPEDLMDLENQEIRTEF